MIQALSVMDSVCTCTAQQPTEEDAGNRYSKMTACAVEENKTASTAAGNSR